MRSLLYRGQWVAQLAALLLVFSCCHRCCLAKPEYPSDDSKHITIKAPTAREYLGRYAYFRSWTQKKRIIVVRGHDDELKKVLEDATYNHRCGMAIRNVNLVLLGSHHATETQFFHSEDNRRDFILTRNIPSSLRSQLLGYFLTLYRDLSPSSFWALLLGYDGGRKRMYRRGFTFEAALDKIDSLPLRAREIMIQELKGVSCENTIS